MYKKIQDFLDVNLKYLITILLLVVTIVYTILITKRINKKERDENTDTSIRFKDNLSMIQEIKKNCNNDDCFMSYSMVQFIINMVKKYGLEKTILLKRSDRKKFTTNKGEYVWIHFYNKELKEYVFLYHAKTGLDNQNMINSQIAVEKVCPKGKCVLQELIHRLTILCDKYGRGFDEYEWFDPKTDENIIKRTFIEKVKKVKFKGETIDIYVGSGATIKKKESKINYVNFIIIIINVLFILVLIWKYLEIDNFFDKFPGHKLNYIYYLFVFYYLYNLTQSTQISKKIDEAINELNSINDLSIKLAGIVLAVCFFFSYILEKRPNEQKRVCLLFVTISIVFALFSFLSYGIGIKSVRKINMIVEIKSVFISNSVIFLVLAMYYIYVII